MLPPNVMLVVDKSGSMYIQRWMDQGVEKNRWESLHETVDFLMDRLGGRINFGLKLFPSLPAMGLPQDPTSCVVEDDVDVPCGASKGQDIMALLPAADAVVAGGTPIASGISAAYEHLKTLDDDNPEAMILIVDGGMSCGEQPADLHSLVSDAAADQIPTYVVGIDLQQKTSASLAAVAKAAGTGNVYNSASRDALVESLESVIGDIVSCELPLDNAPVYKDLVRVSIDGDDAHARIEGAKSCAQAAEQGTPDGWVFLDSTPAHTKIELCGASCAAYQRTPSVDVVFECPPPE